jgi:hypothetical protein
MVRDRREWKNTVPEARCTTNRSDWPEVEEEEVEEEKEKEEEEEEEEEK